MTFRSNASLTTCPPLPAARVAGLRFGSAQPTRRPYVASSSGTSALDAHDHPGSARRSGPVAFHAAIDGGSMCLNRFGPQRPAPDLPGPESKPRASCQVALGWAQGRIRA